MAVRTREIDAMKGVLIFLVVLGHFLLPLLGFGARSINLPFDLIYSFHMPAFVFLSGLFAGHALRSPRHWCKRCLTLLWLYIFFKWLVFYPEKIAYHMPGSLPDFWHESGTPWYVLALCFWTLILPLLLFSGGSSAQSGCFSRLPRLPSGSATWIRQIASAITSRWTVCLRLPPSFTAAPFLGNSAFSVS